MASTSESRDDLKSNHLIKEGDQIILKKGKKLKIFKIKKDRPVWLEKNKFILNGCVGYPYGSKFEVRGGRMVKMNKNKSDSPQDAEALTGKDNRDLHDLDSNQKLTKDDIEKMKKEGFEGKEIIDQLIENSATFQSKTEYAQEKWIKKKKQKHLLEFTVLKPCTRLLCEMYHFNSPAKICYMRMDTIAQILSLGNVRANSTVAVVDTCMGLVVGAVMERLGGFGKVIHFYQGSTPIRPALDNFDFPQTFLDNLYSYPLDQVNCIKTSKTQSEADQQSEARSATDTTVDNSGDAGLMENTVPCSSNSNVDVDSKEMEVDKEEKEENSEENIAVGDESQKYEDITDNTSQDAEEKRISGKRKEKEMMRQTNREAQQNKLQEIKDCLLEYNVDCLIVACKFHPTPIVLALVDYLAPSRPVVVFSQYKEPVMDSYVYLRERGGIVNFRVTESWLREYQVMEMRTHPVISMSGGGGYILTATTIAK